MTKEWKFIHRDLESWETYNPMQEHINNLVSQKAKFVNQKLEEFLMEKGVDPDEFVRYRNKLSDSWDAMHGVIND